MCFSFLYCVAINKYTKMTDAINAILIESYCSLWTKIPYHLQLESTTSIKNVTLFYVTFREN